MPWMLQPKNYTQIARPNLFNAQYRRVGAYKGMGRLHPANYLEIGSRPNLIGGTSGQYNTLSGQLSLLPPSLRGLGQNFNFAAAAPTFAQMGQPAGTGSGYVTNPDGSISATSFTPDIPTSSTPAYTTDASGALVPTSFAQYAPSAASAGLAPYVPPAGMTPPPPVTTATKYLPWIIGGVFGVILLMGMRR